MCRRYTWLTDMAGNTRMGYYLRRIRMSERLGEDEE